MDQSTLQDRIRWGMNIAARAVGTTTDLYRPTGPLCPMSLSNRALRLHAAFQPHRGTIVHTNLHGDALWYGIFDAAYTHPGDYLVQGDRTLFIATQQGLSEPLCVQTNRRVTVARAIPPGDIGSNIYGGLIRGNSVILQEDWPASVLGVNGSGSPSAGLPTDTSIPFWTILMPAWPNITLQPADLVSDDLGRSATVSAAELTELGWRLTVKQASN